MYAMKKLVVIIMIIFTLLGCSSKVEVKTDALKFKEDYESLNGKKIDYEDYYYRSLDIDSDNQFVYKSTKEILAMIDEEETFAVYFGFSSCPRCRSIISTLIEVANDLDIDTIYYVDVREIRDTKEMDSNGNIVTTKEGAADYYKLLDKLEDVLDDYTITDKDGIEVSANEKRIYAPNIVAIVDGVSTKMTTGISDLQENAYMELTDEIKEDSYNMIKSTIECIKEEKAICTNDGKKC